MSSKVRSLEKALKDRQAKNGASNGTPEGIQTFAVEGDAPSRLPHAGEVVEFCWADPNLIDGPKVSLGLLVSLANPQSKDGRVNGWVIMDPTMQMPHPQLVGQTVQVPPLVPVVNSAYSRERKPMTWRYHGDTEVQA